MKSYIGLYLFYLYYYYYTAVVCLSVRVKLVLVIGIILTCAGCTWLCIITLCRLNSYLVVISAVFLGAGSAVLLVSAIAMATEIIGSYTVMFSALIMRLYYSTFYFSDMLYLYGIVCLMV